MFNEYEKNNRHYPYRSVHKQHGPMENKQIIPIENGRPDEWETMDNEGPINTRAPQIAGNGFIVVPQEDAPETSRIPAKKIHDYGDPNSYTEDIDCNDWGGIIRREYTPDNDGKYGPGNYPDDDEETIVRTEYEKERLKHYQEFTSETSNTDNDKERSKYQWFIPNVIAAGGYPINEDGSEPDLSFLKTAGFKAIVSVIEEPIDKNFVSGFDYYFSPTLEGFSNNLFEICEFIDNMERAKKPVFVHSFKGTGRAATVLAAHLIFKNWLTADEAIAYVRQYYNKDAINAYQEEELHRFGFKL